MAKDKTEFIKFTTPPCVAIWPKLTKPDSYKNGPLNFNTKLRLAADHPFVEELRVHAERCFADQKAILVAEGNKKGAKELTNVGYPYSTELDEEGNETGFVKIVAKRDAVKFDKKTKEEIARVTIPIFDGAGVRVEGLDIWGGSEIRVSGWISSYYFPANKAAGAALRITAVQVLKLVSGGTLDAAGYGFDSDGDSIAPSTAPKASDAGEEGGEPAGDGADF
jgi:hypothetical protein